MTSTVTVPGVATVAKIAAEYGLTHALRFSIAYREVWGSTVRFQLPGLVAAQEKVLPRTQLTATLEIVSTLLDWIMKLVTAETRLRLGANHPDAAAEIDKLEGVLDDTNLSPELLALCGAYFDAVLRGDVWSPPASPTALESACLDVCEQFTVSVSGVSDDQIAALNRHLSADEVYNLMSAIYLIEMSKRLDLTLERVLQ